MNPEVRFSEDDGEIQIFGTNGNGIPVSGTTLIREEETRTEAAERLANRMKIQLPENPASTVSE